MIKKLLIASTFLYLPITSIVSFSQTGRGSAGFSDQSSAINSFSSPSFSNSFESVPSTSGQQSNHQSSSSSSFSDFSNSFDPSGFTSFSNSNNESPSNFQDRNQYQLASSNPQNAFSNTHTRSTNNLGSSYSQPIQNQDCSNQANTFFNGVECVCRVGYLKINGYCSPGSLVVGPDFYLPPQFIHSLSAYHKQRTPTCDLNQIYDGQVCRCKSGYQRINDKCLQIIEKCPENSFYENHECKCSPGFYKFDDQCIRVNSCKNNAFYNGVQCVCKTGFYMNHGQCVPGNPCPSNSIRKNNQCVCQDSYFQINGLCSKCPDGKFYYQGQCIILCGENQYLNGKRCQCKDNYAIYEEKCSICPDNSFQVDGYCVFCPSKSTWNPKMKRCECFDGFILNQQGFCIKRCSEFQYYDQTSQKCKCIKGFGRNNKKCEPCLNNNVDLVTQRCSIGCKPKEILLGNQCHCQAGFGYHKDQCVDCYSIQNGFLVNGHCAICPNGLVRIGNECRCPTGQNLVSGKCIDICRPGQLLDAQGFCFTCPLREVIINGRCQCESGSKRINGICKTECDLIFPGTNRCAKCALGTKYDHKLQACICSKGFYVGPNGFCVPSVIAPVQCPKGKYYSQEQGCLSCPFQCSVCESFNKCTSCFKEGYIPKGIKCVPVCGDGKVVAGEQCDDGNIINNDGCSSFCKHQKRQPFCGDGLVIQGIQQCDDKNQILNDGCSLCKIDKGYECNGQPSNCNKSSTDRGLSLKAGPIFNMQNVFITLRTDKAFFFKDRSEQQNFLKYDFQDKGTLPQNVYCLQEPASPRDFRCMLVYNSGLPSNQFRVKFSYSHEGETGSVKVAIDPRKSLFKSRSLK